MWPVTNTHRWFWSTKPTVTPGIHACFHWQFFIFSRPDPHPHKPCGECTGQNSDELAFMKAPPERTEGHGSERLQSPTMACRNSRNLTCHAWCVVLRYWKPLILLSAPLSVTNSVLGCKCSDLILRCRLGQLFPESYPISCLDLC